MKKKNLTVGRRENVYKLIKFLGPPMGKILLLD